MGNLDDSESLYVAPLDLRGDVRPLSVKESEGAVVLATNEAKAV